MAEWLPPRVQKILVCKIRLEVFQKTLSFQPTLYRAGEREGGEEEEWHPASITLLLVQVDALTATSPTAIVKHATTFIFKRT